LSKPWIVQNGMIWSHIEGALGSPLDWVDDVYGTRWRDCASWRGRRESIYWV